ncbi:MAG: hypothetical protein WDZ83_00455 [Rhizobiaceae bacterium]
MEHIAAILLLLGCSDDGRSCAELPAPHVGYEAEQICEEHLPGVMQRAGNSYPLVIGKCIPVDPLAEGDMEIVWDVTSEGELIASVVPYNNDIPDESMVAGLQEADKVARLR